jgi:hypothetical protein
MFNVSPVAFAGPPSNLANAGKSDEKQLMYAEKQTKILGQINEKVGGFQ